MLRITRPTPSHFGIYVTDLEMMVAFYVDVFGLTITDRGEGISFKNSLVFTSASADQHHQLVLASGRPASATFSTVMQISFAVPSIQHMRDIWQRAATRGASQLRGLNHGNALSVYMLDPEGNTVEFYVDMPFYISQPHGDPLDLSRSDDDILRETEAMCRNDPSFKPAAQWALEFDATSTNTSTPG